MGDIQDNVIRHARRDMANGPDASQLHPRAEYHSGWEWAKDWIRSNHAKQPTLMSELSAMVREGIKDIRATIMESYFGKSEHPGEPGAPLNPTAQVVTAEMGNVYGYGHAVNDIRPAQGIPSAGYERELNESIRHVGRENDRGMSI